MTILDDYMCAHAMERSLQVAVNNIRACWTKNYVSDTIGWTVCSG